MRIAGTFIANISDCFQSLSLRNYKERFSALLHAEEVQMELEMRDFDLHQVCGQIMFKEIDFGLKPWADTGKHIVTVSYGCFVICFLVYDIFRSR